MAMSLEKYEGHLSQLVKAQLPRMGAAEQAIFYDEFTRRRKRRRIAYLCWCFGLHYVYLQEWVLASLYVATGWGLGVWAFIDFFRMAGLVRKHNQALATEVLRDQKLILADAAVA